MTSAHHFIDISQNILNLWMRLIFPEIRHLRLQFEHKNETIPIRIESYMFFEVGSTSYYRSYGKTEFGLAAHSHQSLHLIHRIFPKAKIRSRFMILFQPSLNDISFIFPPPLLYKPFLSFIPGYTQKKPPLFSSLLLSFSEVVTAQNHKQ